MTFILIAALLVPSGPVLQGTASATDTSFAVEQGTRLRVKNQGGEIVVRGWDRNQVRVQADHSGRTEVRIERSGSVVEVRAQGRMGMQGVVDYQITVPTWMALDLGGLYAEISVEGTRAPIKAETIEGNITVKGGAESVDLSTINGRIEVTGTRGRVDLHSVAETVLVSEVQGDLVVESVSGDVSLRNVDSRSVAVQTVSGDLVFTGRLADGGSYSLLTHSGDITLGVAEGTNATLDLSSAGGDFELGFPLEAERSTRRRQTFRLGSGSARVDLETFSGAIRLLRPADVRERREPDRDRDRIRVRIPRPPRPGAAPEPPGPSSPDLTLRLERYR